MTGAVRFVEQGCSPDHTIIDVMEIGEIRLRRVYVAGSVYDLLVVGEPLSISGIDVRDFFILAALKRSTGEVVHTPMKDLKVLCDSWPRALAGSAGFATIASLWVGYMSDFWLGLATFAAAFGALLYFDGIGPRRRFAAAARALDS
jgi:hypothetical protein